VFAGGVYALCTTAVAAETALAFPAVFIAVTRTLMLHPTSAAERT
jgi:hypothetical protein